MGVVFYYALTPSLDVSVKRPFDAYVDPTISSPIVSDCPAYEGVTTRC